MPRQITPVFDKGNNSEVNLDLVEQGPLHFVGSLVPFHYPCRKRGKTDRHG